MNRQLRAHGLYFGDANHLAVSIILFLFVGVLTINALLLGVYIRAPGLLETPKPSEAVSSAPATSATAAVAPRCFSAVGLALASVAPCNDSSNFCISVVT